jgi:hypothetical protein
MSAKIKIEEARIQLIDSKKRVDIMPLIAELNIIESLDFPCIRINLAINDSVQLVDSLRGNELLTFIMTSETTGDKKIEFNVRAYRIANRIRYEKKEAYTIECVSNEFMRNEVINVFRSFKGKKAHEIVNEILTDSKYLNVPASSTQIEKTNDVIQCVVPNWRPFDVINWLGGRATRAENYRQGGFIFYQNSKKGYHFKSFDKIIIDANKQSTVPTYKYAMKNTTQDSDASDLYTIKSVSYPALFDALTPLRNGTWAGIFTGISLDYIPGSRVPSPKGNKQIPYGGTQYRIMEQYQNMEHLGTQNPYNSVSPDFDVLINNVKRMRYRSNQVHLWDTEKSVNSSNLSEGKVPVRWEETAIYNYCRKNNFEHIKLEVSIPGNFALHAGEAIDIEIPRSITDTNKIELDKIYSGRYVIGGVRHKVSNGNALTTELTLLKDSLGNTRPSTR